LEGQCIGTTIPSSSHYHLWTAVAELLTNQNSINPTSFKRAYSK
jgi:hypothetical protein